jgi:non-heme chloroperoxidase
MKIKSMADDGVRLHLVETGNPLGRPVVFIHGLAQSHECWVRQLHAPELQGELRMIAFDLRGHGDSDQPLTQAAYHDPKKWALDVHAVLCATGVVKPCVVAWSYAGRVLNDYLSVFGDAALGALNYVAATSTGDPAGRGPAHALMAATLLQDPPAGQAASDAFLRACFERQPDAAAMDTLRRFNAKTPAAVRKLLVGRQTQYADALNAVKVPVLITHGEQDQISTVAMSQYTHRMIAQSRLSLYPGCGHTPFFEDPQRFNTELLTLTRSITP